MTYDMWGGKLLKDMTREELVRSLEEVMDLYLRECDRVAEIRGPTIDKMLGLLHNFRSACRSTIDFMDSKRFDRVAVGIQFLVTMERSHMQETINEINGILKEVGWD